MSNSKAEDEKSNPATPHHQRLKRKTLPIRPMDPDIVEMGLALSSRSAGGVEAVRAGQSDTGPERPLNTVEAVIHAIESTVGSWQALFIFATLAAIYYPGYQIYVCYQVWTSSPSEQLLGDYLQTTFCGIAIYTIMMAPRRRYTGLVRFSVLPVNFTLCCTVQHVGWYWSIYFALAAIKLFMRDEIGPWIP
ncbi:hypothetical protein F5Y15DRAFT_413138 [Xylariaceae sp. FL0016]|nr:hypothetical protein F5Y15DRAFT_413138 [Xylariaceae sp. FL0016]